jgi:hypothetical protein
MAPVVPLGIIDFAGTIRQSGVTWRRVGGMRSRRTPWGKEVATFQNGTFVVHFRHSPPTRLPWSPHPCINTTLPYGKFYTVVAEPDDSLEVYLRLRVHGVTVASC